VSGRFDLEQKIATARPKRPRKAIGLAQRSTLLPPAQLPVHIDRQNARFKQIYRLVVLGARIARGIDVVAALVCAQPQEGNRERAIGLVIEPGAITGACPSQTIGHSIVL
jgi:hypothetical protein